jgi:hypothetical protein
MQMAVVPSHGRPHAARRATTLGRRRGMMAVKASAIQETRRVVVFEGDRSATVMIPHNPEVGASDPFPTPLPPTGVRMLQPGLREGGVWKTRRLKRRFGVGQGIQCPRKFCMLSRRASPPVTVALSDWTDTHTVR